MNADKPLRSKDGRIRLYPGVTWRNGGRMISLYSRDRPRFYAGRYDLKTLELRRFEGNLSDSEVRKVLAAMVFELKLQNPDESFIVRKW